MYERGIEPEDVAHVLEAGEVIEDYPDDKPLPSRLVFGRVGSRPLHVVAADDAEAGETLVVTAYEPDPARWSPDFQRRKPS
jgi:hypothetical protein